MAYPTVCDRCLDGEHERCMENDPTHPLAVEREKTRRAGAVGGAFCICITCHPMDNVEWYAEVERQARNAREASK